MKTKVLLLTGLFVAFASYKSYSQCKNLIINPIGSYGLSGWTLTNGGDEGWAADSANGFISSYEWDTKSQTIDLIADGYTAAQLDAQPTVTVSENFIGMGPNVSDEYGLTVTLEDASHTVITSFVDGTQSTPLIASGSWQQAANTFTAYGTGLRYIVFTSGGQDAEFWDGNYGVRADSAVVIVSSLPTLTVANTAVCVGDSAFLTASGADSYVWNTGDSTASIFSTVTTSTTYTVTGTLANGCSAIDSAIVTVNPLPNVTIMGKDSIDSGMQDTLIASGGTSYVWTSGPTTDTNIVAPTTTTTYSVTATNSYGCSSVDSITVVIKITTGIANLSENTGTTLYPNPATTNMSLTFNMQGSATDATINVLDITGKSMLETTAEISNGKTLPINISELSPGVYFVRISTNKTTQVVKFVKAR